MYLHIKKSKGHKYYAIARKFSFNGSPKIQELYQFGPVDPSETISMSQREFMERVIDICNLIEPELEEEVENESLFEELIYEPQQNLGYVFIKAFLIFLRLDVFFDKKQKGLKLGFKLFDVFCYLVSITILEPSSLLKSCQNQPLFFDAPDLPYWDMNRALTYFAEMADEIQYHIFSVLTEYFTGPIHTLYSDATNIDHYIKQPDPDKLDENGKILEEGLRKFGHSKSGRYLPISTMNLFLSRNGFPLFFSLSPGNYHESKLPMPMIKALKKRELIDTIFLTADSGQKSGNLIFYLAGNNLADPRYQDGYLFSNPVSKLDQKTIDWALDPKGFRAYFEEASNGRYYLVKYKSRIITKTIHYEGYDGRKHSFETRQRQIIYYSEKYARKKAHTIERKLDALEGFLKTPGRLKKKIKQLSNHYIEVEAFDQIVYGKDQQMIDKDERLKGLFMLVTSDLDGSDAQLLRSYRDKGFIEYMFRVLKHNLHLNPAFLTRPDHILAHYLICFVSAIVLRGLQFLLDQQYSMDSIQESLKAFSCVRVEGDHFLLFGKTQLIEALESIFTTYFSKRIIKRNTLKKLFKIGHFRKVVPQIERVILQK